MLDPRAADLVDAVARLCVLRTEDYTLLHTVFARERDASAYHSSRAATDTGSSPPTTSAVYIRYLTEEVKLREEGRRAAEQRWSADVRTWAASFLSGPSASLDGSEAFPLLAHDLIHESSSGPKSTTASSSSAYPVWALWKAAAAADGVDGGPFQDMYAGTVRQAYELQPTDLTHTPFAQQQGSRHLYTSADENDSQLASPHILPRVHGLFFTSASADASLSPTAVLHSLHPIGGVEGAVTELSRARLAMSRHVWLVLFFLWCHTIGAANHPPVAADGDGVGPKDQEVWRRWMVEDVLIAPSLAFLSSQARQLEVLMGKVRTAYGA